MCLRCYKCDSTEIRLVSAVWKQNCRSLRLFGVPLGPTITTEFGHALKPPGFIDRVFDAIITKDPDRSHRRWREEFVCIGCGTRADKCLFMQPDDWARSREAEYREDKESSERLKTLKDQLSLEPSDTMARLELADLYLHRGEYLEALKEAEELVKLAPRDSRAWMKFGDACSCLNYLERAVECYTKSAECGNRRNALVARGRIQAQLGCPAKAQSDFIEAYNTDADPWNINKDEVRQVARSLKIAI